MIKRELDLNETIALAAKRTEFVQPLTSARIPSAEVEMFGTENTRCRGLFNQAIQQRTAKGTYTRTEKSERGDLIRMMRRVQSAALQKYDPDPALRPQLAGYYIGTNLARNHANLAQYSASLLQSVESDPLPGITADAISALRDTRQAWIDTNANQAQASQRSGQHYQEATTLLASLRSVRLGMQHAIDGQFPYDEGESGTARASFHLPVTRPFRTPTRR